MSKNHKQRDDYEEVEIYEPSDERNDLADKRFNRLKQNYKQKQRAKRHSGKSNWADPEDNDD